MAKAKPEAAKGLLKCYSNFLRTEEIDHGIASQRLPASDIREGHERGLARLVSGASAPEAYEPLCHDSPLGGR